MACIHSEAVGRLMLVAPLAAAILSCSCTPQPPDPSLVGIALLTAEKNPDGKGPALQIRIDEDDGDDKVQRFPVEPGTEVTVGPGFASGSGDIQCAGSLKFADDGKITGRIAITTSREAFIGVTSNLPDARVMRGAQEVAGMTDPLPAGEYVVEFGGQTPDSEPRSDSPPRTTSQGKSP